MNERNEVLAKIQAAADTILGDEAPQMVESAPISADEIDSLDLIEIMMIVEDDYDIVLDGQDFDGVTTVSGLVDIVLGKRAVAHE